ncbi:hypothetical protein ATSB10_23580 [Dyella thiooxydans]|uniref:Right handed beta helix domain-containing protein n=1 Tax=Dyella thiooxydans TaxID=445710 RepID=A0A160N378_9GAMM|nr:right-handed parallel beta-helix repeat-containing protein [Dyella thiooxydans]AND69812.1 hypothetical protein ATSB10_23580 [Dyella thiooxydans]
MNVPVRPDPALSLGRRHFLRRALWLAIGPVLSRVGSTAAMTDPAFFGSTVDVRAHGAFGDGSHDDTAALQASVDALPAAGGTIIVPAGRYRIDAARSVRLRSHMHWRMEVGAELIAMPNRLDRSYVLLVRDVQDVEISGGRIVGERNGHLGTTGEWGHGVAILGARDVHVHDLRIDDCWGDGMAIGTIFDRGAGSGKVVAEDVTLIRVRCGGNRRQGLSITSARRVSVIDSQFIGNGGTAPGCGIDVEPGTVRMGAQDVLISGCTVSANRGSGIQVYGLLGGVSGFRLVDNTVAGNHGFGLLLVDARDGQVHRNTVDENGLAGLLVREGVRDSRIEHNTFSGNGTRLFRGSLQRIARALSGASAVHGDRNVQVLGEARSVVLQNNTMID